MISVHQPLMLPSDMLLCIVQRTGGAINGKTTVQKLMYFCCEKAGMQLDYISHYYGPYSQTVDNLLQNLSSSDFLIEERWLTSKGRMMYKYMLTDDGNTIAERATKKDPNLFKNISNVVSICGKVTDLDSEILSAAAKAHYILKKEKRAMNPNEIIQIGNNLGWELSKDSLKTAFKLLEALNLAKTGRSKR